MSDKEQQILSALSYLTDLESQGIEPNHFYEKEDGIEVSRELLGDADFIKRAVFAYPGITYFLPNELRSDHEFVFELYNLCRPCTPGLVLPLGETDEDMYYLDYEEELRLRAERQSLDRDTKKTDRTTPRPGPRKV